VHSFQELTVPLCMLEIGAYMLVQPMRIHSTPSPALFESQFHWAPLPETRGQPCSKTLGFQQLAPIVIRPLLHRPSTSPKFNGFPFSPRCHVNTGLFQPTVIYTLYPFRVQPGLSFKRTSAPFRPGTSVEELDPLYHPPPILAPFLP